VWVGEAGLARARKKKARAKALGASKITAAIGIFARLTPTMHKEFTGARTTGSNTRGNICVPVLISQPAFITDHVQTIAAAIVEVRIIHLVGLRKQMIIRISSITNIVEISAMTQPKYSDMRLYRNA